MTKSYWLMFIFNHPKSYYWFRFAKGMCLCFWSYTRYWLRHMKGVWLCFWSYTCYWLRHMKGGVAIYKNKPNSDVGNHHFYKMADKIIHVPRMDLDLSYDRSNLLPTTIFFLRLPIDFSCFTYRCFYLLVETIW